MSGENESIGEPGSHGSWLFLTLASNKNSCLFLYLLLYDWTFQYMVKSDQTCWWWVRRGGSPKFRAMPEFKLIFSFRLPWTGKKTVVNVRNCVMGWENHFLNTLEMRKVVIDTFSLSKLWFLAQNIPLPKKSERSWRSIVGTFLWKMAGAVRKVA